MQQSQLLCILAILFRSLMTFFGFPTPKCSKTVKDQMCKIDLKQQTLKDDRSADMPFSQGQFRAMLQGVWACQKKIRCFIGREAIQPTLQQALCSESNSSSELALSLPDKSLWVDGILLHASHCSHTWPLCLPIFESPCCCFHLCQGSLD